MRISDQWRLAIRGLRMLFSVSLVFQSFLRMASAADIAKLETKAVAAEKLIELLRQQISQVLNDETVSVILKSLEHFRSR